MSRAAALALFVVAIASGCREEPAPPSADRSLTAVEADWRTQIAAVRAGRSDEIRVSDAVIRSDDFRDLAAGCDGLATLVLDRADLSTPDLAPLPSLPALRQLKLPTAVDDEAADVLSQCRALEALNLPAARLTDAGLARLATLDRLSLLRFASPDVTDDGLEPLSRSSTLKFLHLLHVPITDAGLAHVAAIPTLESFYLDGGRVTDAALSRLLETRPDLHFHKDQTHLPGDPNADRHE